MRFYISREDLLRVDRGCDLGDSVGVRVYMYPHRDTRPNLIECSSLEAVRPEAEVDAMLARIEHLERLVKHLLGKIDRPEKAST